MPKFTRINTQAEVISCTGTLTLLSVRGRGELSDMVGKLLPDRRSFKITNFLLNVFDINNCLHKSCYQYSCLTAELLHLVHMNKYSTEALTHALHCSPEAKADYHYFDSQLIAKSALHHIID